MANNYVVQLRGTGPTWTDQQVDERFYNATTARLAAETQLEGGPEYQCVRVLRNGEPIVWNDGRGWQDWTSHPEGKA